MFGKTKDNSDIDEQTERNVTIDDFFGDEDAVAEAARVDLLHRRVTQVEQQISSQFTSLAAYAQIAQEQVELVRSEAQHANERSQQRVISLIERERADRIGMTPGRGSDVTARLDSLDAQVTEIRDGLQQCLSNQKALADAITDLFQPAPAAPPAPPAPPSMFAPFPSNPTSTSPDAALPPLPSLHAEPAPITEPELDVATIDFTFDEDLDRAEPLDVDAHDDDPFEDEMGERIEIGPIEPMSKLVDGPIDGLSLA